jgi:ABC-2 type transport system ATP-binding protein
LLVLDEPTDGLDPVVRRDVLGALLEYVEQSKATVFISSHLVHELERICDWIGVMDRGRLAVQLPMERFRHGIKRVRVAAGGAAPDGAPFTLLARETTPAGEEWSVRDWSPEAAAWLTSRGVALREVTDLDLEEAFVELLRSFRSGRAA